MRIVNTPINKLDQVKLKHTLNDTNIEPNQTMEEMQRHRIRRMRETNVGAQHCIPNYVVRCGRQRPTRVSPSHDQKSSISRPPSSNESVDFLVRRRDPRRIQWDFLAELRNLSPPYNSRFLLASTALPTRSNCTLTKPSSTSLTT